MSVNPQGVGESYSKAGFFAAQTRGWELLHMLQPLIKVGQSEEEARAIYKQLMSEFGVEKNWHPPKIRFGPNTTKAFQDASDENYRLQSGDLYFLDLGPIIDGYEVDVGKTFFMDEGISPNPKIDSVESLDSGEDALKQLRMKALTDGPEIFHLVQKRFFDALSVSPLRGPELYLYAQELAEARGWTLVDEGANGHRIGDFPHHGFYRGSLREFSEQNIVPELWILEIQIVNLDHMIGSFTEDCLGRS